MPLFFIITLIISLLKNKGNRNVVNGNDVNNINNEPGNNDDAVLMNIKKTINLIIKYEIF